MFLDCASLILVAPHTLAIKQWLKNQIFTFSTSSLKPPVDGASYCARSFPRPRHNLLKIKVKFRLQALWQNFENGKMQKLGFCLRDC